MIEPDRGMRSAFTADAEDGSGSDSVLDLASPITESGVSRLS
jgi:hypothetical protein